MASMAPSRLQQTLKLQSPIFSLIHTQPDGLNTSLSTKPVHLYQEEVIDATEEDKRITKDVIAKVNEQIEKKSYGRLFAVVHIQGKQFKITTDDIIVVETYWPPELGEQIKLEKVLLVGGSDFTLVGRPIISTDMVSIKATVVEKTYSSVKIHFFLIQRKRHRRTKFTRVALTFLRINEIELLHKINEKKDFEGVEGKVFL